MAFSSNVRAGILQRCGHAHDAGDVLRTGSLAPLLCAALDETREGYALPDIQQHLRPLGAVELVAERQHIDVLGLDVNGHMPRRLYGVGVEQHARLAAYGADLLDGRMLPISLLAYITVTRQVSGRMASFTCWAVTVPVGPTGSSVTSKPCFSRRFREWRTAWCSKAVEMMCFLPFSRPNSKQTAEPDCRPHCRRR